MSFELLSVARMSSGNANVFHAEGLACEKAHSLNLAHLSTHGWWKVTGDQNKVDCHERYSSGTLESCHEGLNALGI